MVAISNLRNVSGATIKNPCGYRPSKSNLLT